MAPFAFLRSGNKSGPARAARTSPSAAYGQLEADDYDNLEHDGLDAGEAHSPPSTYPYATSVTPQRTAYAQYRDTRDSSSPSANHPRADSRASRLSGNSWTDLGAAATRKSSGGYNTLSNHHHNNNNNTKSRKSGGNEYGLVADSLRDDNSFVLQQPVRRASRDSAALSHPTPGLQALQGAYMSNISRLEDSAAKMTLGLDIETELAKLREEQRQDEARRAESRRSSLRAAQAEADSGARTGSLTSYFYSRGEDDLPTSPTGYQPVASNPFDEDDELVSPTKEGANTTDSDADGRRAAAKRSSFKRASLFNPASPTLALHTVFEDGGSYVGGSEMKREPSKASNTYSESVYESVKSPVKSPVREKSRQKERGNGQEQGTALDQEVEPELEMLPQQRMLYAEPEEHHPDGSYAAARASRRGSTGSMNTIEQAATLFKDFDGEHIEYHDLEDEEEEDEEEEQHEGEDADMGQDSKRQSRRDSTMTLKQEDAKRRSVKIATPEPGAKSMLDLPEGEDDNNRTLSMLSINDPDYKRRTMTLGPVRPQTPPDGHVFYPAPIPAVLSLPQKLSKGPSAAHMQNKKADILANVRKSALMPGMFEPGSGPSEPGNRASLAELDPHVKASLFFDHKPLNYELKLIDGSATKTLDAILDAAVGAPLGAFTDHPYAGILGPEVYGPPEPPKPRAPPNSRPGQRGRANSAMALSGHESLSHEGTPLNEGEDGEDYFEDATEGYDGEGEYNPEANDFRGDYPDYLPVDAARPTTLLAELQLRKAEQKARTRTAATAFPNGMHSTLLQLDAVAQYQAKSRRGKRTRLAWEDPEVLGGDEDDDIPLGVLVPNARNPEGGLLPPVPIMESPSPYADEDEPVMMDHDNDSEPEETLGERRARLTREAEEKARAEEEKKLYTLDIGGLGGEANKSTSNADDEEEDEDVPLAVRKQRLHQRNTSEFASELMSQLGELHEAETKKLEELQLAASSNGSPMKKPPGRLRGRTSSRLSFGSTNMLQEGSKATPQAEQEEETLGQRRRRMRAQQAAKADAKILQEEVRRRKSVDLLNGAGHQINDSLGSGVGTLNGSMMNPMHQTPFAGSTPNMFTHAQQQSQQQMLGMSSPMGMDMGMNMNTGMGMPGMQAIPGILPASVFGYGMPSPPIMSPAMAPPQQTQGPPPQPLGLLGHHMMTQQQQQQRAASMAMANYQQQHQQARMAHHGSAPLGGVAGGGMAMQPGGRPPPPPFDGAPAPPGMTMAQLHMQKMPDISNQRRDVVDRWRQGVV